MGREYYYLISTLPMVRRDARPPMTSDEFLSRCATELSPARLRDLASVSLVPGERAPSCDSERRWLEWETYLRNCLVRYRGHRLETEIDAYLREEGNAFPADRKLLEEGLNRGDPLTRERSIDALRWTVLDDLGAAHMFDFDALVVYRLRLLLADKASGSDEERGKSNLGDLVDAGVRQAEEHRTAGENQAVT